MSNSAEPQNGDLFLYFTNIFFLIVKLFERKSAKDEGRGKGGREEGERARKRQ